jgi:hypothetical protein
MVACALALALAGCDSSTTLLVEIVDHDPSAQFAKLHVRVFDVHGAIGNAEVTPVALPGALTVRKLPAQTQLLRVVVAGDGHPASLAAGQTMTQAHRRATLLVDLTTPLSDRDGDGVPDIVDDCPDTPDPDQKSAHGGPPGDACGGLADLGMPFDQAAPPGSDLSIRPGSDLATPPGSDLSVGPDMAGVLLSDDFNGNTLDPTRWIAATANGGQVSVGGGVVTLRAPATAAAFAEIASIDSFPVGTIFTARVHLSGGQTYDIKGAGYANKRLSDVCGTAETESAMVRGQNADLLFETETVSSPKCQPLETGSPYAAGDRTLQITRLSPSQVDFVDGTGAPIATVADVPGGNLPVRFGVFTSSANPPQADVIMTVDWVRVVRQ